MSRRSPGAYYDECAAIMRVVTGAARVLVFDHTLRGPDQPRDPVMRVHNDYTENLAPQRVHDLVPHEAEAHLTRCYVFINVWRPIGQTVIDTPLTLCDACRFTDDDLIMTDLVHKDRLGETASVRHAPPHRWVFFSRMTKSQSWAQIAAATSGSLVVRVVWARQNEQPHARSRTSWADVTDKGEPEASTMATAFVDHRPPSTG